MDIIINIAGIIALFFVALIVTFGLLSLAHALIQTESYRRGVRSNINDPDPRTRKNALRCLGEKYTIDA